MTDNSTVNATWLSSDWETNLKELNKFETHPFLGNEAFRRLLRSLYRKVFTTKALEFQLECGLLWLYNIDSLYVAELLDKGVLGDGSSFHDLFDLL
ncbi:MAG TPA: hypothetical protein VHZ09_19330 [Acidobacteriaceae bacterium]|jgi:hypothetical protein|nr:hypothetical protein [Acidobacteriaceae bacterium]